MYSYSRLIIRATGGGGGFGLKFSQGGNILQKSTLPERGECQTKIFLEGYPLYSFWLAHVCSGPYMGKGG